MSFFAEMLVEAIGWPVVVIGLVLVLYLPSRQPEKKPAAAPAPQPVPEPRVPRDTSRPYPRPKGSRSKLNRVCPVCGTGRETGDLDGRVLGWPAHASCAEWLGDWEPPYIPAPPRPVVRSGSTNTIRYAGNASGSLGGGAGGSGSISVVGSPGAQVNAGNGNRQDGSFPVASTDDLAHAQEMVKNGAISLNEARERLNRQITASWGVPPAMLEQHTHKAGDPIPVEECPKCGARFCGPPDYLRSAYKTHQQTGCRQSSSLLS